MYDRPRYVDPLKDSEAAIKMVANGLSTLEEECGNRGKEWLKIRDQRNREVAQADLDSVKRISAIAKALQAEKQANPEMENITVATILAIGGATTAPAAFLDAASQAVQSDDAEPAATTSKGSSDAA
jgi:predicted Mrr-cat superfamily restriction endonuclease